MTRHVGLSLVRTLRLYSTFGVLYIALNSVTHPRTLGLHVTHLASWPSEGTFGLACLVLSFTSTLFLAVVQPDKRLIEE
jgi:amino acid permease